MPTDHGMARLQLTMYLPKDVMLLEWVWNELEQIGTSRPARRAMPCCVRYSCVDSEDGIATRRRLLSPAGTSIRAALGRFLCFILQWWLVLSAVLL